MYSTCLFCHSALGSNETIEHFPVGRRLAYDLAKGRLWVICPRCARWNLTPLEERWEAQEECERMFRSTKLRHSTEQIGLARVGDGLELVRIGEPLRPEMAAWRYGGMFRRRLRANQAQWLGAVAAVGGIYLWLPAVGAVLGGAGAAVTLPVQALAMYRHFVRTAIRLPAGDGELLPLTLHDLLRTRLTQHGWDWGLELHKGVGRPPFRTHVEVTLRDDTAMRATGAILARLNQGTGRDSTVRKAVGLMEEARDVDDLFRSASRMKASRLLSPEPDALVALPAPVRLALEMAGHEETERIALEGDLRELHAAWCEAEEIAAIADNLLLPASIEEQLARLRAR